MNKKKKKIANPFHLHIQIKYRMLVRDSKRDKEIKEERKAKARKWQFE